MVLESNFPPDIRVSNEAASLIESGHEVHIACFGKKDQAILDDLNGLTIHRFPIGNFIHKSSVGALKLPWYFNFWKRRLSALVSSEKFDAIHVHDLPLASVASHLRKKFKVKFVLDLHENWPALLEISTHTQTFLGKRLCSITQWKDYEIKYATEADKVIVVVDEAKDRLTGLGVEAEKIYVLSNTLNMDLFDFPEQVRDPEHVTLVYGGAINYHRGLQYVIEAIPLLKDKIPNIRLWIIGQGSYLQTLKDLASSLKVSEFVKFWGWKQQKELLELISQSDYALIPHVRSPHTDATIPHKIFQYMYAEIPIISTDCLPLKRILEETGTGVCYKDRDAESFASVFLDLYANKSFLKENPESGKLWVEKKYNWTLEAKNLTKLYNDLT